jgi:iron-sulfur cluster insertion protein
MNAAVQIHDPKLDNPLLFSEAAARKVWELMEEEENLDLKLRVFITGGGCSGFQYGFTFDETIKNNDTVVKKALFLSSEKEVEVTLLVDPMSLQLLMDAEIDYKEDLEGARFVIRNPNAQTTCGCGSSFSVQDKGDSTQSMPLRSIKIFYPGVLRVKF